MKLPVPWRKFVAIVDVPHAIIVILFRAPGRKRTYRLLGWDANFEEGREEMVNTEEPVALSCRDSELSGPEASLAGRVSE